MNPYSIETIEQLIIDIKEHGRSVQVVFKCPHSDFTISSRASIQRDRSFGNQLKKNTERSILNMIQREVTKVLRDVLGNNAVGRMGSDIARRTMYNASSQVLNGLSNQEREEAILSAFKKVESKFRWNEEQQTWLAIEVQQKLESTLSPFLIQNNNHPVSHPYDVQILSRMLVEIVMADGEMVQAEREWLVQLLNPEYGTMEQISQFPPLTKAEFHNCSPGPVRTTMLMMAFAMSMCDETLAQEELVALETMANHLQLSESEKSNARFWAQTYILEQAIHYISLSTYGNLKTAREQILQIASRIGVSSEAALNIEAKVKRRQSNF